MKKYNDIIIGIAVVGVITAGLAALVIWGSGNEESSGSLASVSLAGDWTKGNKEAAVKLVEYSDFQCPACRAYYPILKQLAAEYGDRIEFSYRHFPLPQHVYANPAARAAEAAGRQGKFWEMHDMIFENQGQWATAEDGAEVFRGYAASLGLDSEEFNRDVDSEEVREKVRKDYEGGVASKVNSTPTFFLNGKKLSNPRSYADFKEIIEQTLEQRL